jgi:hypothetical protein
MATKTKLELTWIGKENRPRLEPRILLEDPAKSYHAKYRVKDGDKEISREGAKNAKIPNSETSVSLPLRDFAASRETHSSGGDKEISREGAKNAKKKVARIGSPTYKGANTRAVPLVRKEDVHHGRVFCVSVHQATASGCCS